MAKNRGKDTITGGVGGTVPNPLATPVPDPDIYESYAVGTYAGGTGTPPPGTTYTAAGTPILPEGWAGIGGPNDEGDLTYVEGWNQMSYDEQQAIIADIKGYTWSPGYGTSPYAGTGGAAGPPGTGTGTTDPEFTSEQNSLMAVIEDLLNQYGLATPGLLELASSLIAQGKATSTEILLELRKHPDYLANPLFAAHLQRTQEGKPWMSEAEVLAWGAEAKRLATQFGYSEPSDDYLATGLLSGLSTAEIEHRFTIQDTITRLGAGVQAAALMMGFEVGDADLYEIFDPEIDTKEWDDMFRRAQMMGQPLALGLGIRTETEARALEMLGVDPEEAFARYESVAANASRFARLGTIEENIRKGLPDDFGSSLGTEENSLLIKGLLFNDPAALAQLQDVTAREIARFKGGPGAAQSSGQSIGLLSADEKASYG